MSNVLAELTTEFLQSFADAFNRHDAEALMSFMTDDCVFEASAGPDACGARFQGREAVRAAFEEVWTTFPDAHWDNAHHIVCGDRGVSDRSGAGAQDGVGVNTSPALRNQPTRAAEVRPAPGPVPHWGRG